MDEYILEYATWQGSGWSPWREVDNPKDTKEKLIERAEKAYERYLVNVRYRVKVEAQIPER